MLLPRNSVDGFVLSLSERVCSGGDMMTDREVTVVGQKKWPRLSSRRASGTGPTTARHSGVFDHKRISYTIPSSYSRTPHTTCTHGTQHIVRSCNVKEVRYLIYLSIYCNDDLHSWHQSEKDLYSFCCGIALVSYDPLYLISQPT